MFRDMLVTENTADGIFKPMPNMGQLEKFGKDRHQNARTDEQHQHGDAPHESVDGAVYLCDHFYHNTFPPHCLHVRSNHSL